MFILTTAMEDPSFGLNGIKCVIVCSSRVERAVR